MKKDWDKMTRQSSKAKILHDRILEECSRQNFTIHEFCLLVGQLEHTLTEQREALEDEKIIFHLEGQ